MFLVLGASCATNVFRCCHGGRAQSSRVLTEAVNAVSWSPARAALSVEEQSDHRDSGLKACPPQAGGTGSDGCNEAVMRTSGLNLLTLQVAEYTIRQPEPPVTTGVQPNRTHLHTLPHPLTIWGRETFKIPVPETKK